MSRRIAPKVRIDPGLLPLVLVGLPGSGKTTVARLLANALGVQVTDTDAEIRRRARMTVPQVFTSEGEDGFRDRETRALREVLDSERGAQGVVALGGGAVLRRANRQMLRDRTVIHLDASPATAAAHVGDGAGRPLLAADDGVAAGDGGHPRSVRERIEELNVSRAPLYSEVAKIVVPTDDLNPQQVAALILVELGVQAPDAARVVSWGEPSPSLTASARASSTSTAARSGQAEAPATAPHGDSAPGGVAGQRLVIGPLAPTAPDADGRVRLTVAGRRPYSVVIGAGMADSVVEAVLAAPGGGAGGVALVHADALAGLAADYERALGERGLRTHRIEVPGGERAKCTGVLDGVWRRFGADGVGRDGCVVGLGGGATTDLAGFAAATWMRGVSVVQVPTTLLGMVDAAVGGKTGIDIPAGKNLVGAFHPPAAVVCDLESLTGLPRAELRAGLAEVIKCGLIADPVILDRIMADPTDALVWDSPVLSELVARSVAVKAAVVGQDLTESGLREVLNYGHTYAHAIETLTDHRWRHGEAVAVGCVFAAEAARAIGLLPAGLLALHREAMSCAGLPTSFPQGAGRFDQMRDIMARDKKVRGGRVRMVLLEDVAAPVGGVEPGEQVLRAAHGTVTAGQTSS